jgi:hypothetical protein
MEGEIRAVPDTVRRLTNRTDTESTDSFTLFKPQFVVDGFFGGLGVFSFRDSLLLFLFFRFGREGNGPGMMGPGGGVYEEKIKKDHHGYRDYLPGAQYLKDKFP